MGADRPIEQAADVSEGVMGLIGCTALDDRTNRGCNFLRRDVGNRAYFPTLDELAIDDAFGFCLPAETAELTLDFRDQRKSWPGLCGRRTVVLSREEAWPVAPAPNMPTLSHAG